MYEDFLPADAFTFDRAYMTLSCDTQTQALTVHGIAGDPDDVFPLASVTKPIVAWSALVAVEQGVLDLDVPAGPEGSTVRHLLAHASGVPAAQGAPIAAPATRRIYSNYGFDLLGKQSSAPHPRRFMNGWQHRFLSHSAWIRRKSTVRWRSVGEHRWIRWHASRESCWRHPLFRTIWQRPRSPSIRRPIWRSSRLRPPEK